jgi:hypothetical protein
MGKVAEALRANLRELAQSDARSLRLLQAELGGNGPDALASLGVTKLRALCKERGVKGSSRFSKPQCLEALRGEVAPAAVMAAAPATPSPAASPAASSAALARRLDRLEALLVLVAETVGVPAERMAALLRG